MNSKNALFAYFNKSKIDQYLGELSYPLYMTHFFCIGVILKYTHGLYIAYLSHYIILLSTAVSILLIHWVVMPIDRYRHRRFVTVIHREPISSILPLPEEQAVK